MIRVALLATLLPAVAQAVTPLQDTAPTNAGGQWHILIRNLDGSPAVLLDGFSEADCRRAARLLRDHFPRTPESDHVDLDHLTCER